MTGCVYREMTMDDYDPVYALWKETPGVGLSSADSPEAIAAYLARNPGQSFVCEGQGRILGAILCGNDGRRAYIHHTAVRPECRRRGVAGQLLRLALDAQRTLGMAKCHLMVFRENLEGQAFWEDAGFVKRGDLFLMSRGIGNDDREREGDL